MAAATNDQLPTGTVTFLFTDIEGSTRMLTQVGEGYAALLAAHAEIMRSAIVSHGGTEVDTQGDSFFAAFPSAIEAVGAAVTAQRGFAAAPWPEGSTLRVRMGLHSGEARIGGDGYVGLEVHRAARIAAAGHGGQVLVSDATRTLVEGALTPGLSLTSLGEHRLKDFDKPMRISQLDIAGLPDSFPALRTLDARPGNIPEQLNSFFGRTKELGDVEGLVGSHRLVTLTGPGGTGKTRLALQVARDLIGAQKDGAYLVDAAAIRDAAMLPLAVAGALGVRVDPGGDALTAVGTHLRDRELLLVLDNLEQIDGSASVVEALLSAGPRVKILVTSRIPLAIYGEQEYEVPPFDTGAAGRSDAIDLFVDRARAVRPAFELTDEHAASIGEVIARLDGLPLAIELAAGQVRMLSPSAILSHLDRQLPLLTSSARGLPERQRTMERAIAWSYDLLEEPEQRLFPRLSTFPGGCSLDGADAVGDAGDLGRPVLQVLDSLISKSLLRQAEELDGEPRFRMLATILEYGRDRLRQDFDADATYRRLGDFYLRFAEEAAPHLAGEEQATWLDRCEREGANLRRALDWATEVGQADTGIRTATALSQFWQLRGPIWEGRRLLDTLLTLPGSSTTILAKGFSAACELAWWDGDHEATRRHAEAALGLVQGTRQPAEVEALYNRSRALLWTGLMGSAEDLDRSEDLARQSKRLAEDLGDRKGIAKGLRGLGMVLAMGRGDVAAALPMFDQAVALLEELGDRTETVSGLVALGNGHRFSGDLQGGRSLYLRAIDLTSAAGNRSGTAGLMFVLAGVESELGHHNRVATIWGAATAAREASGATQPPMAARLIGDPLGAARTAIGDGQVEQALDAGRAMDEEAMLAYAHAD